MALGHLWAAKEDSYGEEEKRDRHTLFCLALLSGLFSRLSECLKPSFVDDNET